MESPDSRNFRRTSGVISFISARGPLELRKDISDVRFQRQSLWPAFARATSNVKATFERETNNLLFNANCFQRPAPIHFDSLRCRVCRRTRQTTLSFALSTGWMNLFLKFNFHRSSRGFFGYEIFLNCNLEKYKRRLNFPTLGFLYFNPDFISRQMNLFLEQEAKDKWKDTEFMKRYVAILHSFF